MKAKSYSTFSFYFFPITNFYFLTVNSYLLQVFRSINSY